MTSTATAAFEKLKLTTPSDREIALTRVFAAPRRLVFDALTKPELVRRWLLGPPGWSMPVCDIDLRVGGTYRYQWSHSDGTTMGVRGTYREVAPPERLVTSELFDEAWYPGEAQVTTVLIESDGQTTLTSTIIYESQAARDAVVASPMDKGVALSYGRLEELLAGL